MITEENKTTENTANMNKEELFKTIRRFASDNPVKAHNILVREFGMTSRRADMIISKLRKQEQANMDVQAGIDYATNLGLLEEKFVSKLMKELEGSIKSSEMREGMDRLCEAMEDEILNSNFSDDIKKKMMARLRRFTATKTNIMLVGATGSGKSSTINALFSVDPELNGQDSSDSDYHYVEVAKVGTKADPETKIIEKYTIGNLTLWDTPGLGDATEEDKAHTDVIEALLDEEDNEGNALIDLVLVVLDGSTKDLGTTYRILNSIILPRFEDEPGRVLVALNQSDIAMKTGRHWDYEKNKPDDILISFLEEKIKSIHDRILEDTGIEVNPIYYCAGYKEEETDEAVRPYNLSKLLLYIVNSIPPIKRIAVFEGLNTDSENYRHNDDDEDYSSGMCDSFFDTVGDIMESGMELGHSILGLPGAVVGGALGAAVGAVVGLFQKIFY